jgi:hypothetical protein
MSNYFIPENIAISESGFLFLAGTGETFTLNHIGRDIFYLIRSKSSEDEILNSIISDYDIDKATAHKDLTDFIAQLKHYSILKEE